MGVFLALENYNEMFSRHQRRVPIIVNDFSESSEDDKENINKLIYTKYSTDLLSNLPSCECGEIAGEYNIGVFCTNCNTNVQSSIEHDLEPIIWIRSPIGVAALINPIVWTMLNKALTRSGFEILKWICDTTYKPSVKTPALMDQVYALNITRGYNNFVQNFDYIVSSLFKLKGIKDGKEIEPLQQLLMAQRDCVFSTYLPLPNKSLLVVEETNVGTYIDPIITGAIDAIRTMVSIDSELSSHNLRTRENRTVKTIAQLAEFYNDLYRTTLAQKEGIFRKHVFGTRSHFSFRAVISSLTDEHAYDELHIPWGVATSVFRIHLINKLLRRGFTPNSSIALLNEHAQKYHALLDELFNELINEAPRGSITVVIQRNPSLERASAQKMSITKVKTDVAIPTISLSILSVVGFNADFDGKYDCRHKTSLTAGNPLELN